MSLKLISSPWLVYLSRFPRSLPIRSTDTILKCAIGECRFKSTSASNDKEATVVSEDGNIIVCWHPEPEFPYECSKPLPKVETSSSPLKATYDQSLRAPFGRMKEKFELQMLQSITYTNKHIWFPQKDRKLIKFKEKQPRDREYL